MIFQVGDLTAITDNDPKFGTAADAAAEAKRQCEASHADVPAIGIWLIDEYGDAELKFIYCDGWLFRR